MNRIITNLEVWLNQERVGHLTRLPGERLIFGFDEAYFANSKRSVLSQSYYDTLGSLITEMRPTQTMAPPFFANLLPEGPLRDYLAQKSRIKPEHDFELLRILGVDLPGAVIIKPSLAESELLSHAATPTADLLLHSETLLRFSLAGVQLKFSALTAHQGKLTMPAHGMGGDWIVKLPSARFTQLPENEYAMLQLARRIGIDVPEIRLLPIEDISSLPDIAYETQGNVLAVKRFDRNHEHPLEQRIHMEDFAQVYGAYPHRKYEGVSYNNIANMLSTVLGEEGAREFVRRLIFNLLIGNHDMHLKNWSLLYPDGKHPTLAPAYDYVATHLYLPHSAMALSIAGEHDAEKVDQALLKRFARKAQLSEKQVLQDTEETIEKTINAWQLIKKDLPLTQTVLDQIEAYLQKASSQLSS